MLNHISITVRVEVSCVGQLKRELHNRSYPREGCQRQPTGVRKAYISYADH